MKTGDNMKEHPQRLELRERIIDTALNSFATHGIKSITMDDIAAALGISKRTLYEVFSDKETLLMECILPIFSSHRPTITLHYYLATPLRNHWFNSNTKTFL